MVYFVLGKESGLIKIGLTCDVLSRIRSLGEPVEILAVILGGEGKGCPRDTKIERHLHRKFARQAVCGEWFVDDGGIRNLVEKLVRKGWAQVAGFERFQKPKPPKPFAWHASAGIRERVEKQVNGFRLHLHNYDASSFISQAVADKLERIEQQQLAWCRENNIHESELYNPKFRCPVSVAIEFILKCPEELGQEWALKRVSAS